MTHESATTVKELPEALPRGEHILWQGRPEWRSLYRRAFHGRTLAIYFAVLLALRGATVLWVGGTVGAAAVAILWLLPAAMFSLGVLALLAWLSARATWYTITDKRVCMRIGVVLEITFNFPFQVIDAAGLHRYPDGSGDIPLVFMDGEQIAYAHLWPHARPWRLRRTEPMMRCVPDASKVAALLSAAIRAAIGPDTRSIRVAFESANLDIDAVPSNVASAA